MVLALVGGMACGKLMCKQGTLAHWLVHASQLHAGHRRASCKQTRVRGGYRKCAHRWEPTRYRCPAGYAWMEFLVGSLFFSAFSFQQQHLSVIDFMHQLCRAMPRHIPAMWQ